MTESTKPIYEKVTAPLGTPEYYDQVERQSKTAIQLAFRMWFIRYPIGIISVLGLVSVVVQLFDPSQTLSLFQKCWSIFLVPLFVLQAFCAVKGDIRPYMNIFSKVLKRGSRTTHTDSEE